MELLTADETAKRAGVPLKRVHRALRAGELPARKVGRIWFVTSEDVDQAIEKGVLRVRPEGRPRVRPPRVPGRKPGRPRKEEKRED